MDEKKLAFGMSFDEFCELYKNIKSEDESEIFGKPLREEGQTSMEFLTEGCLALIKENPDIVAKLI